MSGKMSIEKAAPICAAIVTGCTTYFLTKDHSTTYKTACTLAATGAFSASSYFGTLAITQCNVCCSHLGTYYKRIYLVFPTILNVMLVYFLRKKN